MNAILLASAGVVILLVGGGAGFWIGRSGVGGSKARVEKAEAELEKYKRSVTEHFGQTAAQFQAIGKQYRELYEHMANGAQALCEPGETGKQLLFFPGADVRPTNVEEAEVRPPSDYAEPPVVTEEADASDATEETAAVQEADTDNEAKSTEADVAEASVAEAAAEPQPETEAEVREQTFH